MRITRIYLRNYRVYEEELNLEIPPGLVGIYGPNGAGKSYLIESIRWTLFGKSRTSNDEIRTSGVNGDCITEIEFEHEGHLYLIRRTLSGINASVRAEAWADNQQVGEGARDVGQYVHSILGMDDAAFRSSVFAEQNQVAAFSQQTPAKRRDLVLRLLGITPLDRARDEARRDAKATMSAYEKMRDLLPDLDAIAAQVTEQTKTAEEAAELEERTASELATARAAQDVAESKVRSFDEVAQIYAELIASGKAARKSFDQASEDLARLDKELAELAVAQEELVRLTPIAAGIESLEQEVRAIEEIIAAQETLASLSVGEMQPPPDEYPLLEAQGLENQRINDLAGAKAALRAAQEELKRVEQAHAKSASLSTEHDCPLCGQELGDAFEQVQKHRDGELHETRMRVERQLKDYEDAKFQATEATEALRVIRSAYDHSKSAWDEAEHRRQRREHAQAILTTSLDALADISTDLHAELANGKTDAKALLSYRQQEVHQRRQAAAECQRLTGRLERQEGALSERSETLLRVSEAGAQRQTLLDKLETLSYRPDERDASQEELERARKQTEVVLSANQSASVAANRARSDLETLKGRLGEAQDQHTRVAGEAERARHLGRAADLLSNFRNSVVSTVGPRLATQAADLFAELTDNEYDRLEVNADNWEIQIRDAGRLYDMSRFSGSETDLANLALRVAISEHVRFQAGGAVGLLVLDEVFGPLDDERKERMLLALERLKGHFRQVLVVTHANSVKEQLPNAIEVIKLAGRRATARVLAS